MNRRDLLKTGAAAAPALLLNSLYAARKAARPNFLLIITDQHRLDAIAGHGCKHVSTPNIDRLMARGTTFHQSFSTNPVCSPARSSIYTSRMPVETGVIKNGVPIKNSIVNMGECLSRAGYDTYHCGKVHLPWAYPARFRGFNVIPVGTGFAEDNDRDISKATEAFFRNRTGNKPFLFVSSLLNPHDICAWVEHLESNVLREFPFAVNEAELPPVPANLHTIPPSPEILLTHDHSAVTATAWRRYMYIYYRYIEMVDREIGRFLEALESSPYRDNTIVVFTSDHGESLGNHENTGKGQPYEESIRVPMIVSCPGLVAEGFADSEHLVSGLDVLPTFCDYAGVETPEHRRGLSLRPLLEKRRVEWRDHVCIEWKQVRRPGDPNGRVVRSSRYKYAMFKQDGQEMFFDLKDDPLETRNLIGNKEHSKLIQEHRQKLRAWEERMIPA